jgi:hypothetical protein
LYLSLYWWRNKLYINDTFYRLVSIAELPLLSMPLIGFLFNTTLPVLTNIFVSVLVIDLISCHIISCINNRVLLHRGTLYIGPVAPLIILLYAEAYTKLITRTLGINSEDIAISLRWLTHTA